MNDLRYAIRLFAKSPGFTVVVVATLALGIGANTAVFSIVNGVLLRPLPYRDPGRLVDVLDTSVREKELAKLFASYRDFEEYSRHARSAEAIGAATWATRPGAVLRGRGRTKSYLTIPVTAGFFRTLGVNAQMGRTFSTEDLGGGCAVVLSDPFWRGPLHGDAGIVGQTISLDKQSCRVIGVMPSGFGFYPPETQIWTLLLPGDPRLQKYFGVFIVARLKPGVTLAQFQSEIDALHSALNAHASNGEEHFAPLIGGLQEQFTWLAGRTLRTTLLLLFGAVFLVLCIACLNVANLFLVRSFVRGREFAIRAALGSGRTRLMRQMVLESTMLCGAGGLLGLLLAFAAVRYFVHSQPIELPVATNLSMDVPTLVFNGTLAAMAALLFGVIPAWRAGRGNVQDKLRSGGVSEAPARQRLMRLLVGVEMALSVILLAGAGLLMRSVLSFGSAPLGFEPEGVMAAKVELPREHYPDDAARATFFNRLRERLGTGPGIEAAVASTLPPYELGLNTMEVAGRPVPHDAQLHDVGQASVESSYFRVLRVPLDRGRLFDTHDRANSQPVAVVNQALVSEYFQGRDPIGQQIRVSEEKDWLTVVGVVGNERRPEVFREMSWRARAAVYRPVAQKPPASFSIAARREGEETAAGRAIQQAIASIDGDIATGDAEPLARHLAGYLKYPRFRAMVLTGFSMLAILLAGVGLYGVVSQFAAQRTREIGLRMAVGAQRRDIFEWVVKHGGIPVLVGLLCGLVATLALARFLTSLLYGVTPTDPATFAGVTIVMLVLAVIALTVPA
ncbi:MAG TPA: ABC transporter permease, partial [Bryobacteraceae bacterium]